MKRKPKIIIIFIGILLITTISLIAINKLKVYILSQYETHTFTIESIENGNFIVASQYPVRCIFSSEYAPFYDSNGNIINISDLNIKDTVYIIDELTKKKEAVTVLRIDNNFIIGDSSNSIRYIFSLESTLFCDSNENIIDISERNIGDTVYIIDKLNYRKQRAVIRKVEDNSIIVDTKYSILYTFSAGNIKIIDSNGQKTPSGFILGVFLLFYLMPFFYYLSYFFLLFLIQLMFFHFLIRIFRQSQTRYSP